MNIYTSYFANLKNLPANYYITGIVRYLPRYVKKIPNYRVLAPSQDTFQTEITSQYTKKFLGQLEQLDARTVYNELEILADGRDVILLCYEKPGDFCHRRLVAEWLSKNLQIEVPEYQVLKPQEDLFA